MDDAPIAPPYRIELVAADPARNVHRRYAIACSADLFGAFIVTMEWGRTGAAGQRKVISFEAAEQAARHIRSTLRRRATAPTRIGVPYAIVAAEPASAAVIFPLPRKAR